MLIRFRKGLPNADVFFFDFERLCSVVDILRFCFVLVVCMMFVSSIVSAKIIMVGMDRGLSFRRLVIWIQRSAWSVFFPLIFFGEKLKNLFRIQCDDWI